MSKTYKDKLYSQYNRAKRLYFNKDQSWRFWWPSESKDFYGEIWNWPSGEIVKWNKRGYTKRPRKFFTYSFHRPFRRKNKQSCYRVLINQEEWSIIFPIDKEFVEWWD